MTTNAAPPTAFAVFRRGVRHLCDTYNVHLAPFIAADPQAPVAYNLFLASLWILRLIVAGLLSFCTTFAGLWLIAQGSVSGDDAGPILTLGLAMLLLTLAVGTTFVAATALVRRFVRHASWPTVEGLFQGSGGLSAATCILCLVVKGLSQGPTLAIHIAFVAVLAAVFTLVVHAIWSAPEVVRAVHNTGFAQLTAHQKLQILSQSSTRREDTP